MDVERDAAMFDGYWVLMVCVQFFLVCTSSRLLRVVWGKTKSHLSLPPQAKSFTHLCGELVHLVVAERAGSSSITHRNVEVKEAVELV